MIHCDPPFTTRKLCSAFGDDAVGHVSFVQISTLFKSERIPTDEDVRFIAESFGQLKGLSIDGEQFTDACCDAIVQMNNLESLWVHDSNITGAGLRKLAQARQLKELLVDGIESDRDLLSELQHSLPSCRISGGGNRTGGTVK